MEEGNKNLYQVSDESHARRPLLIALVVLILAALALIMWWQSASRERAPADLTEAEKQEILNFLNQEQAEPTEAEAAAIIEHLNSPGEADNLSEYEREQILDYLQ
jgi:flagellar basal body-associated protein FliL